MKNEKTFSSDFITKKGGDLRAMFYNIYGWMWHPDKINTPHLSSGPIELRQKLQAEMISLYAPDVIGMQEYSIFYHKGMTPRLIELGYREVPAAHTESHPDGTKHNYTVLFYRPEALKLVDQGFLMFPRTLLDPSKDDGSVLDINDVGSKSLTWAVFEEIKTQKRFAAICTHFMYSAPYLTPEQQSGTRVQNAQNVLKTISEIRKNPEYRDIPVIMGGDLNCVYGSDPFKALTCGGMKWLWDVATVKDNSRGFKRYSTYDEILGEYVKFEYPVEDPKIAIDYIFYMPSEENDNAIEFGNYITVTDYAAQVSSDHCPRFTDFCLQK